MSSTATSISPVGRFGLIVSSERRVTRPRCLHDPFASHLTGEVVRLRVQVGIEDGLHDAGAVAQVDEDEIAVVPSPVNPSR